MPYDSAAQALMPVVAEELADSDFSKSPTTGFGIKFDPSSSISVTRSLNGIKLSTVASGTWNTVGTTVPSVNVADSVYHTGVVTIGGTAPTAPGIRLDVIGTAAADLIVAKKSAAEGGEIQIESLTGSSWVIDQTNSPAPRLRIFNGAPPAFMTILDTGLFGFGVVAPTTKVHIASGTANDSGLRLQQLTSTSPVSAGGAVGVDTTGKVVRVAAVQKAVITQALNTGVNTITHNLNLTSTFRAMVEVRNPTTGSVIGVQVVPASYAANSLQIQVGAAVASAQIIIIG
jgi:hypothetical protein